MDWVNQRVKPRASRVRIVAGVTALVLVISAAACASDEDGPGTPSSGGEAALTVAAALYPIAAAAEAIGGDCVEVVNLTPPGVEPHDLELTPDDVEAVVSSDVVLYLGSGFQPAVEDAIGDAEGTTLDVLSLVETVPAPASEAEEGLLVDPHVWLDPGSWTAAMTPIAQAMHDAAPDATCDFTGDAEVYAAALTALDRRFASRLDRCESDVIVTNHAAFGYLASAYGLTQHAISGLEPAAEPTPERLAELKDLVQDLGVTTVFSEALVSPEVAQTLADEANVEVATLNTLEGLTPEEIESGESYSSVMRTNLETLERALGCS